MKKAIIKLLVASLAFVFAGTATTQVKAQDYAGRLDSVTHATVGADTVSFTITKSRPAITLKYQVTKNSGTVAGTIVTLARITPPTSTETWTQLYSDSLTNATADYVHTLTANNYVYYMVIFTTTGTSSTTNQKWLLYRGYYPLQ